MSISFSMLLSKIRNNDCRYQVLDLTDYKLSIENFKQLNNTLANNNVVGRIKWPNNSLPGDEYKLIKENIEDKVLENLINFKLYPTHYEYGLLSDHVYKRVEAGNPVNSDISEKSKLKVTNLGDGIPVRNHHEPHNLTSMHGWSVFDMFENNQTGFYAALYQNPKYCQMVLAYRGSEKGVLDFLSKDWQFDIYDIALNRLSGHMGQIVDSFGVMKESVINATDLGYQISFTGHSLGGWLANVNAYLSDILDLLIYPKSVTFDSPGIEAYVDKTKSTITNEEVDYEPYSLDITNYVSYPNFVNTLHKHIGKVIFVPGDKQLNEGWWDSIKSSFHNASWGESDGLFSVEGHLFSQSILPNFNKETGYLSIGCYVKSWPVTVGDNKDFYKDHIGKAIDENDNILGDIISIATQAVRFFVDKIPKFFGSHVSISQTLPYMSLNILLGIKEGGISWESFFEQYMSATRGMYDIDFTKCAYEEDLGAGQINSRFLEGHLRLKKLNYSKGKISPKKTGVYTHKLLKVLHHDRKKFTEEFANDNHQKKVLENLSSTYELETHNSDYRKCAVQVKSDKGNFDIIEQRALRTIILYPELKEALSKDYYTNNEEEIFLRSTFFNTMRVNEYFIDRHEDEFSYKSLLQTLHDNKGIFVSGAGGIGKTELSIKVGREWYDEHNSSEKGSGVVLWFDSSDQDRFYEQFCILAKELNIEIPERNSEKNFITSQFLNDLESKLEQVGQKLLFIFDNYMDKIDNETQENLRHLLSILSYADNVKLLITSMNQKVLIEKTESNPKGLLKVLLSPFSNEDITEYFKSFNITIKPKDWPILDKFSKFPLQIKLIAKYLSENPGKNISDLDSLVKKDNCILSQDKLVPLISEMNPEEKKFLLNLVYLNTPTISIKMFEKIIGSDVEKQEFLSDDLSLVNIIGGDVKSITIHQEIIKLVRSYMDCTNSSMTKQIIVQLGNILNKMIFPSELEVNINKEESTLVSNFCLMLQGYDKAYAQETSLKCDHNAYVSLVIGNHLYLGEGLEKNVTEALQWFENAAKLGNPTAYLNLGSIYYNGKDGIVKDCKKAKHYFERSAELGKPQAIYNLGVMHSNDLCGNHDDTKAFNYYKQAADFGYPAAQHHLATMIYNSEQEQQNKTKEEAFALYKKSAEKGYLPSQAFLGYMYLNGEGTEIDIDQALYWLKKAADRGNPNAQFELGLAYYYDGRVSLERDPEKAYHYLLKAAILGHTNAMSIVGCMQKTGDGTEKDEKSSNYWLKLYHDRVFPSSDSDKDAEYNSSNIGNDISGENGNLQHDEL